MKYKIFIILIFFSLTLSLALKLQPDAAVTGKAAPDFTLMSATGENVTLSSFKGNIVVLEWFNPDCPFVRKHYGSKNMQKLQKQYTAKGVVWLTINSSAEGKQGYCTAELANKIIKEKDMASSAFLLDHDGKVGKLYDAKTTPHMFVVDQNGVLVYAGAIDDKPSTKIEDIHSALNYLQAALEELMAGKSVSIPVTQPYGCSVKYATKQ
jgi:peroxiredoxin